MKYCSLRKPQKWSDKDTYRSNSNWPRERGERVEGRELAPIAVATPATQTSPGKQVDKHFQRGRRSTNCHEAIDLAGGKTRSHRKIRSLKIGRKG